MIKYDILTMEQKKQLSNVLRQYGQLLDKKQTYGVSYQQQKHLEYCFNRRKELLKKLKDNNDL